MKAILKILLCFVMLVAVIAPFSVCAENVEYSLVDGTETTRYDSTTGTGFWIDYTGASTLSNAPLTISQTEGIIDFYSYRAAKLSGAANRLHQLWTPKNNVTMQNFIAGNKINYMTMRIKLTEPPKTNLYEHAIVAGNFGVSRTPFLGELIRFCRPSGSDSPKIVLGGTPTTGTYEIYLVEGSGTELMSYSYNKWYTITFEINTEDPNAAVVKATVLDEETSAQTVSQPYSIATVDSSSNAMSINSLRMNTYVGYGGLAGDNFHIYLDYIKIYHKAPPTYMIEYYKDSVAEENRIDVLEPGNIVGRVVFEEGYWETTDNNSLNFVMAAYRNNRLVNIKIARATAGDQSAMLEIDNIERDEIIKSFMWNSLEQLTALGNAKVLGRDLYLFIGQSNMASRAPIDEGETGMVERTELLAAGDQWEAAAFSVIPGRESQGIQGYNRYSTVEAAAKTNGFSSGYTFAQAITAANPHVNIGLIYNAIGGTSISQWQKGAGTNYYEEAVRRTKVAMRSGRLRGILWHQGEANNSNVANYLSDLNQLVTNLREDLGVDESVPFIASQLLPTSKYTNFNTMIPDIVTAVPNADYIESTGATDIGDGTHFNADGQKLLGMRYAAKILDKVYHINQNK